MHIEDVLSMPDKLANLFVCLCRVDAPIQMGVPLLCRLGYCIPLHSISVGGPSICQEAAGPDDEGMVHETRWPNSCL